MLGKINYIMKIVLLVIIFSIFNIDNVYATQAKWDAYPQWGIVLRVSFISLWLSILVTIIGIIVKFVFRKLNKKSERIDKIIDKIIKFLLCITLISRLIVELDEIHIYHNAIIYFIFGIIISIFIMILTRNMKVLSNNIFYIIILCVLVILLVTNNYEYPYKYECFPEDSINFEIINNKITIKDQE